MKTQLSNSWLLTGDHAMAAEEKPVLADIETPKAHQSEGRIMGVSAHQVVSLVVEAGRKNYFFPIYFHGFPALNRKRKRKRD